MTTINNVYPYLPEKGFLIDFDPGQVLSLAWGIVNQHPHKNLDVAVKEIVSAIQYLKDNMPPVDVDMNNPFNRRQLDMPESAEQAL